MEVKMKDKRYLVAGTGISGISATSLLLKTGADVVIYDGNEKLNKEDILDKIGNKEIKVILGELKDSDLENIDTMVLSPGIAIDAPFVNMVRDLGVEIIGEIELAYLFSKGRVIGITGTNGKTTTTALTGEIMKNYFESTFVVGNIGIPYTDIALDTKEDSVTVAEISSFQLETVKEFHPVVTAVLNITPDHLNRHYTMENYTNVKMDITKNQLKNEVCVLNYEDEILRNEALKLNNKVLFFSSRQKLAEGIYLDGEDIIYNDGDKETLICKVSEMKLVGIHNVENVMAASALAIIVGVPIEVISKTIKEFKSVEHRIEYVRTLDDVIYYNDSKGTNTDASIKAIEAMTKPTVLIAGGYDKGSEFDDYIKAFNGKIKKLILLGVTKEKIAKTAEKYGYKNYEFTDSLEEAVNLAKATVVPGDVVLLSPACASWDMFKSYEERGNMFKEYVNNL
ncbi:MAG: UDP-N-acetylmuramoyl-L-alanine--D-glutamate ligase [Lachnospiraceae bacterium]|nr:UDP-N-acetylmuramoyl-L-alanine--D-glutamate ligase [Lachnospiraceae bacterium]